MRPVSRLALTPLACVLATLLGGCASAPTQSGSSGAAGVLMAEPENTTGSRIRSGGTDRNVRKIGNAGAREMERDRPPSAGTLNN